MTDHAAYMKEWTRRNRERLNAQKRARRAADPEAARAKRQAWEATRSEESRQKGAAYKQAWAEAHREKTRTANKAYAARVGPYWKHIKHKFGVTRDEWLELFKAQDEKCAVCKRDTPATQKFWSIDHCHKTGETRGILCRRCNIMLGAGLDDPNILMAGAKYLKSHQLSSSASL